MPCVRRIKLGIVPIGEGTEVFLMSLEGRWREGLEDLKFIAKLSS